MSLGLGVPDLALSRTGVEIRDLFRSGEVGVWYDPSDLLRYTDSSTLGPELVTNGGPFTDTTGWTAANGSLSVQNGWLRLTSSGTPSYCGYSFPTTIGSWYLIEGEWRSSAGTWRINVGTTNGGVNIYSPTAAASGVIYTAFQAQTTATWVTPRSVTITGGDYVEASNISVRELTAISTATLFQDSAGATPVTALEQPVGLMLDHSQGLATASISVTNGTFATDSDWTKGTGWTIGSGVATKAAGTAANLTQTVGTTAGQWYKVTAGITRSAGTLTISIGTSGTTSGALSAASSGPWYILAGSGTQTLTFAGDSSFAGTVDNVTITHVAGHHAYQATSASRPTLTARVNKLVNTATLATQNVTTIAGSYTLSFYGTGTVTLSGTSTAGPLVGTGANDRVSLAFTPTAGTLTCTVSGSVTSADLRLTAHTDASIPAYQRVGAATAGTSTAAGVPDYDADGFPVWLSTDGTDDGMLTPAIDFSGTDKVTVWAGVTKLSDATQGIVVELTTNSNTNPGFYLAAPSANATSKYGYRSTGTVTSATDSGTATLFPAPDMHVHTMQAAITDKVLIGRIDGVQVRSTAGNQGAGNYSNAVLYLFRRGGSSLPFTGLTSQIIARGASSTSGEITGIERIVARKTGKTL